VIEVRAGGMHG
jgi:hypothetical protein